EAGAELLAETVARLDDLPAAEQDHSQATLAPRLTRQDGALEWEMGAEEIDRRVRALQPWPGATLPTKRGRVKVLKGHVDGSRYAQGNLMNHEPMRPRKLLLHRKQIASLIGKVRQKGYTLIPLRVYFARNRAKVEIGLGRGKRQYDKRQAIAERDAKREIERA